MLGLGVGLGEDEGDGGDVAERDPHLLTVDPPAGVRLRRPACGGWRRRSRCRARSGRSSRTPRRCRAAAATRASAPRCPSARSSRRRARSGRRRRCARRSRRARPARARARRRRSRGRGRRIPRRPWRRGSPSRRACGRARRRSAARGRTRARAARSTRRRTRARGLGDQPLLVAELEVHRSEGRRARSSLDRCAQLVGGGDRVRAAASARAARCRRSTRSAGSRGSSRRGTPRWRRAARPRRSGPPRGRASSTITRRVIESRIPVSSSGVRRTPSLPAQKTDEVGASSTIPSRST